MLRRDVPTMSGKMIVILHVPEREEIGYMYLTMTGSFGKSCCWNRLIVRKGKYILERKYKTTS